MSAEATEFEHHDDLFESRQRQRPNQDSIDQAEYGRQAGDADGDRQHSDGCGQWTTCKRSDRESAILKNRLADGAMAGGVADGRPR